MAGEGRSFTGLRHVGSVPFEERWPPSQLEKTVRMKRRKRESPAGGEARRRECPAGGEARSEGRVCKRVTPIGAGASGWLGCACCGAGVGRAAALVCVVCVVWLRVCVLALGLLCPRSECAGGGGLLPPGFPPGGVLWQRGVRFAGWVAFAVWCDSFFLTGDCVCDHV